MKLPSFLTLLFSALVLAGGVTRLSAQTFTAVEQPVDTPASIGLIGATYSSVGYGFIDFDGQDVDAHAFKLDLNQNLGGAIDAFVNYEYDRSERFTGGRVTQHLVDLGARVFAGGWGRFKPYAEAGVGWVWFKNPLSSREDSFLWTAGAGVEIGFGDRWSVAPFVRYYDLHDFADSETWNYGVRANYWFNARLGFQVSATQDDDHNREYALGVNFRL